MSGLSTSQAILLGSVVIGACAGAGLYFGTRRDPTPAPQLPTPSAPPVPSVAVPSPPPGSAARPAEGAAPELKQRVLREITASLEKQRATLKQRCWDEAAKKNPLPRKSEYLWNVTVDARGQQIIRGISEAREGYREGVAACLSATLPAFEVSAPGVSVTVEAPFSLP